MQYVITNGVIYLTDSEFGCDMQIECSCKFSSPILCFIAMSHDREYTFGNLHRKQFVSDLYAWNLILASWFNCIRSAHFPLVDILNVRFMRYFYFDFPCKHRRKCPFVSGIAPIFSRLCENETGKISVNYLQVHKWLTSTAHGWALFASSIAVNICVCFIFRAHQHNININVVLNRLEIVGTCLHCDRNENMKTTPPKNQKQLFARKVRVDFQLWRNATSNARNTTMTSNELHAH